MRFGEKLKQLRTERNLTRKAVAAAVGVSQRTYVAYEQEGVYPRKQEMYRRLADYFECDVNYLRTEDEVFVAEAAERYGPRGKRQAQQLVAEISGLFAGGELADEDKDEMMRAIQEAYWIAKEQNRKHIPQQYRREGQN